MGILNAMLGRREPVVEYRTVDGGHPAPYPDMTDEQLYNYEIAFNVPNKTFDRPPRKAEPTIAPTETPTLRRSRYGPATPEREAATEVPKTAPLPETPEPDVVREPQSEAVNEENLEAEDNAPRPFQVFPPVNPGPPLDFSRPVRTITSKQPVEIVTTRARHPVYKVHAYIGNDDVVTVFTIDGRLSENGPRFLENVPEKEQLFLNVYPHPNPHGQERFLLTQHGSREEADAQAGPGRLACVPVEFDPRRGDDRG